MNIMQIIREAGQKRKLLYIEAQEEDGSVEPREVEPYSFRQAKTGTLFFGWDIKKNAIRSFRVDRIIKVRITDKTYDPRFPVEL